MAIIFAILIFVIVAGLTWRFPTEKDFKIPTQPEKRERALQALIKKQEKPIALFVDEAHDLHRKTLINLKRLIEVVQDGEGVLSIIPVRTQIWVCTIALRVAVGMAIMRLY